MKKVLFIFALLSPAFAFAQAVPEEDLGFVLQQILKAIGDWKAIGWQAGLAALLTVVIGTMKNSLFRAFIWDKIPQSAKVLVAPVVAIAVFALGMGKDFNIGAFAAALTTGVASVYLHQLLLALKDAPFVGEKVKAVLDFLAKLLKKPQTPA